MYLKATLVTIAGWFIGMVLDANIDFGDPMGFLTRLNLCIFTVKMDIFIAKTLAMYGNA